MFYSLSSPVEIPYLSSMPHRLVPVQKHVFLEAGEEKEERGNQEIRWAFSILPIPPLLKANIHVFGLPPSQPTQKNNFYKRIAVCDPGKSGFNLD